MATLLQEHGLADHPLFAQAKARGIRALAGHAESTDVTNDVNGGPSGIGVATAAGKAAFWDVVGAPINAPKIITFEGEFAMTEGHAQELKTQALALKVGKRLRVMISDNNAGIDDSLIGGVIDSKYDGYKLVDQWTSYGWNVFEIQNGNDYDQVVAVLKTMEEWDPDRSPADGRDRQDDEGLLAGGVERQDSRLRRSDRWLSQPSVRDEDELGVLPRAGEDVREALRRGVPGDSRRRREGHARATDPVQDQHRRRDVAARSQRHRRLARGSARGERRVAVKDDMPLRIEVNEDPFLDERLRVAKLPVEPQKVSVKNAVTGAKKEVSITLFRKAGEVAGTRRGISEIVKWVNYVTGNRFVTVAADLSESINLEHGSIWGHYDPERTPSARASRPRFRKPATCRPPSAS